MIYYEVDYSKVIVNKLKIIKSCKELNQLIGDNAKWDDENHSLQTSDYRVAPIDLTAGTECFDSVFSALNIDFEAPTMFLSECVIIYIPTEAGNSLINWTSNRFKESVFITYEQIKPYDEFGSMMIKNIENKGCPLLSINSFPEIKDQRERYLGFGWKRVDVLDMLDVYNYFIEKERVKETERLEIFDEFEEWYLIQGHYCYVLAINSQDPTKIKQYHFEDKKPLTKSSGTIPIYNKFMS
ncbi:leucine carboxyl methyltransferase [Heterostelium album PN500]|uniref:Leucine carboxyl methyltransferase 1 n=1 Tax=Heterostelium pallidum (strain ATCC 26659 / Pp 5 / PN500) TaxID=670386 RepID=D3B334_HETP5|nr:leucine carboxyl methyltransferase [Heterostelium album PN500]EFA83732.1 leucine carboxyl methyltransferase [Heterostelium album PN500]|eukprot:XP_020435849.1 leucine carboxyl methyltransferase [Heterostelium album PN500]